MLDTVGRQPAEAQPPTSPPTERATGRVREVSPPPPPPFAGDLVGALPAGAEPFYLASDGSARDNGAVSAVAAYAVVFPTRRDLDSSGRLSRGYQASNNSGELMGATRGLRTAAQAAPGRVPVLLTDSSMLILAVLRHAPHWRDSPPTRLEGARPLPPVRSGESQSLAPLIRDLGAALRGRVTVIHHVASHPGLDDFASHYNGLADHAAGAALGSHSRPPPAPDTPV